MGGTATTGGVTLSWAAATDVGNHRSVNEDSVLAAPSVFVVADGMGGHYAGDIASRLVVEQFESMNDHELHSVQEVVQLLEGVNQSILDRGRRSRSLKGMGTTAVGLLLVDNGDRSSWLLFNIGDSRAYRRSEGRFEQLSVDHSYVQELVDAGELTADAARTHPHRNVVTRALGVEEGPTPDLWLHSPRIGERFLLCSDGLSSEVDDPDIAKALATGTPEQAADALVARALAAGGHDNVTVLVLDVLDVEDEASAVITSPRELVLSELTVPRIDASTVSQDEPTREQPVAELDVPTVGPSAGRRGGPEVAPPAADASGTGRRDPPATSGLIDRVPGQAELEELIPVPDEPGDADGAIDHTGVLDCEGPSGAAAADPDADADTDPAADTEPAADTDADSDPDADTEPAAEPDGSGITDATDSERSIHGDDDMNSAVVADLGEDVGGAPSDGPTDVDGGLSPRVTRARTSSGRSARRARGKRKETGS